MLVDIAAIGSGMGITLPSVDRKALRARTMFFNALAKSKIGIPKVGSQFHKDLWTPLFHAPECERNMPLPGGDGTLMKRHLKCCSAEAGKYIVSHDNHSMFGRVGRSGSW